MEIIPTAIRQRGLAPCLIWRTAAETRLSVAMPSVETSMATTIPRSAVLRSMTTLAAAETRLPVFLHFPETWAETITQLSDFALSISPTAMATQPSVLRHSKTILAASGNIALGNEAGLHLTNGNGNIAIGSGALGNNVGGKGNIALGNEAGSPSHYRQ